MAEQISSIIASALDAPTQIRHLRVVWQLCQPIKIKKKLGVWINEGIWAFATACDFLRNEG